MLDGHCSLPAPPRVMEIALSDHPCQQPASEVGLSHSLAYALHCLPGWPPRMLLDLPTPHFSHDNMG